MVLSKKELFNSELQQAAGLFKVLSHPARLQILIFLSEMKDCFCGNITDIVPLGRTTVNQHLKELKNAGLIKGEISGSKTKYCLNSEKLKELQFIIEQFSSKIDFEGSC